MNISITTMTMDDYDAACALWEAAEGVSVGESDSPEHFARYIRRNPDTCFAARIDAEIVGTLLCGFDGRRGYLNHMAVATSHRRKGVGTALLDHCMAILSEMGITKCNLFVYEDNHTGIAFWQSCGWRSWDEFGVKVMTSQTKDAPR